ncbi:OmpA/MotB domain protein [Desulfarculus baarsii DSM 2075]|uniref:OmpA/MotB domain protein n=1 Tax=Desulfarculus baarsii (strain ATCC 33931 / DSM 2075 / LMG 7858 / VKM B-1802 / 2st14) TaxID=644282 RepID=E1QJC8_DESB2|nr:OmpA family protein [Desulfarculus baarsii]ADK85671.1 OmpA/MotB domain protein [Desulfarculus baarsii DSM 2075]
MARKKQEEQASPGIVVLYTALMILLLAFFILLNSMGATEESKVRQAYKSLMDSFGFQEGGVKPFTTQTMQSSSAVVAAMNPIDEDYVVLRGMVFENRLDDQVRLLRSQGMRTVVINADMLFAPGSAKLSPNILPFLDEVAAVIKDRAYPLSVYGHTDDEPWRGKGGQDNWTLSAQRALSVVAHLVSRGVSASRLAAFGLAGTQPIASNTTAEGRRQNNRVALVFNADDASQYMIPENDPKPKLDFRGFQFDLMEQPNPEE